MIPLARSQYEDAARAVIEPGLEPEYSQRLEAAAEVLRSQHARWPHLEGTILECTGPSPQPHHRDVLRCVLAVIR